MARCCLAAASNAASGRLRGCPMLCPGGPVARHARHVHCMASKTTSSRSQTTSSSESLEGTTSTKQPVPTNSRKPAAGGKPLQGRVDDVKQRIGNYFSFLTPKQEGDLGDVLMMSLSMAVLIYFSMQLYRLYAYAYFHMGHYQTMVDMMQ